MAIRKTMRKKTCVLIQMMFITIWATNLTRTDSYYSVYALCCVAAVMCLYDNYLHGQENSASRGIQIACVVLSVFFSAAVVLANYPIFQRVRELSLISIDTNQFLNTFDAFCTVIGGIFVGYQVLWCAVCRFPLAGNTQALLSMRNHPRAFFAGTFCTIAMIDLIYLFLVVYPGNVTWDSIDQITQIVTGTYVNDHPFWHTQLIRCFWELGYRVFGNSNAAVAVYSTGQVLIMAACFAYALVTLYQAGISQGWILLSFAMYAFLPHNFTYSVTMGKDVLFSGAVLMMTTAALRILRQIGKHNSTDYVLFALGEIGVCVLRTNGWASMLASALIMAPLLLKKRKKLAITAIGVLVVGMVMVGPVLSFLNVGSTDPLEAMSVPIQQISRVIAKGGTLTEEETALLDRIVDLENIPELYSPKISDPIKDEIRSKDRTFLKENLTRYGKLWIQIGCRYPRVYLEAWIELTKGYWNGGYNRQVFAQYVHENEFGIYMPRQTNIVHNLVGAYLTFSKNVIIFEPIQSIGLHVWLMVILCFLNILKKREEAILFIPCFVIILGLWLGTPVYAEFRYAYPIFTVYPLLLPVTLCLRRWNSEKTGS